MSAPASRRGRPRCAVVVVPIKLRLHPGEDDDLIAFFEAVPPRRRAQAVLVALRSGGLTCAMSGEDVDEAALAGALENLLF